MAWLRDLPAQTGMINIRIDGVGDRKQLESAWREVARARSVIRVRFRPRSSDFVQELRTFDQLDPDFLSIGRDSSVPPSASPLSATPFVLRASEDGAASLTFHHAFLDKTGAIGIVDDLRAAYAGRKLDSDQGRWTESINFSIERMLEANPPQDPLLVSPGGRVASANVVQLALSSELLSNIRAFARHSSVSLAAYFIWKISRALEGCGLHRLLRIPMSYRDQNGLRFELRGLYSHVRALGRTGEFASSDESGLAAAQSRLLELNRNRWNQPHGGLGLTALPVTVLSIHDEGEGETAARGMQYPNGDTPNTSTSMVPITF